MSGSDWARWTFSLDGIAVEAGRTYMLTVFNLPEPAIGDYKIRKQITIPGCDDRKLQTTQMCLENGSQWDPRVTTSLSVDKHKMFTVVEFEAAKYSDKYQVTDNRTSLIVTFELDLVQLPKCEIVLMIKPFFIRCRNDCCQPKVTIIDYCPYYPSRSVFVKATVGLGMIAVCLVYLLCTASRKDLVKTSTFAAKEQPESFQVQEKKRVFIIYSLDHHLYKNIVLKLCAFLGAKCGTEVVLDLLDSTRLGVMGNIQWLDWHREQITSSSNKILILCSRGVQAKWRAMCGEKEVSLREDVHSPVGDMLTPALSLIVPSFVQHASFETYIVAYFDDICSEEDVPSPFNITVRYKLMKQFEELFFRIIDTEKHQPGRINVLEGLAESEYHHCPAGRALRDAIQTFQAYQLEHPDWFEEELLNKSELEDEGTNTNTNHLTYHGYVSDSAQVLSHEETQDGDSVDDKAKFEMCSMRRCSQFD
ncbi:interleukin-17 receptor A [Aulostomus maculatus]